MKKIIIILALLFIQASSLFGQNSTFDPLRIGSRIGGSTPGSLLFVDLNKKLAEDNDGIFFDISNIRLGVATNLPGSILHVSGAGELATFGNTAYNDKYILIRDSVANGVMIGMSDTNIVTGTTGTYLLKGGGTRGFAIEVNNGSAFADVNEANFVINTGGDVGLGTVDPQGRLHVIGDASIIQRTTAGTVNSSQSAIQIGIAGGTYQAGGGPAFLMFGDDTGNNKEFMGRLSAIWEDPTDGAEAAGISFSVRANAGDTFAATEVLRATSGGDIGVGVTDPAEKVEVESGDVITGIQISNTAVDGDPVLAFALSGTKKFTMGVDDGDGDDFKIGITAIGTNTRFRIDGTDGDIETYQGMTRKTTRITSNTTLDSTHHKVFCDTDGGAVTVTFPAGSDGREYILYNTGSNDVTVAPNGLELIDGVNASKAFSKGQITLTYETTEGWW